jgi:hypothetical protein
MRTDEKKQFHKTVTMSRREIPVVRETDVLVIGGGYAGFGAALCAARNGAKTILVERESALGGLATLGYVSLTFSYIEGAGYELFANLKEKGAVKGRFIDPEKTKLVLEEMLLADKVEILYNSAAADAIVEDNVIKGAIVQNRAGFQAILAKRVIDASGDGDISAWAGAQFECGSPDHDGCNQATSLVMRVGNIDTEAYTAALRDEKKGTGISNLWQDKVQEAVEKGDLPGDIDRRLNWAVIIPGRDPKHQEMCLCFPHSRNCKNLDPFDLTRQILEQRRQADSTIKFCRKYIPGYESAWLIDTAPLLGVRDSRRIIGEYILTGEDLVSNRRFPDAVCRDMHALDAHHPTELGHIKHVKRKRPDGGVDKIYVTPGGFRDIPYRALVPLKIENLLTAGRNISTDFMGQSGTRLVLACLNMGQAAGTAAALSIKENVTPRKLNVKHLQSRLIETGFSLNSDPEYGVSGLAAGAKIAREDLIVPVEGTDSESSAMGVRNAEKYQSKNSEERKVEEILQSRGGYTKTGGDVGTYLE